MVIRLEIKKIFQSYSDRVKEIEMHPKEPYVLISIYSGVVSIWNYKTESIEKTYNITNSADIPVRCSKFIARKNWFISGSDDMQLSVFNYATMEKVNSWNAHSDYIRSIAIHPTLPLILSSSDDTTIKLWNWEKDFTNTRVFEGHFHYVMQIQFNPKDANTFASASLDQSVKVWGLESSTPHFSLEGHTDGINCLNYYSGSDRPLIASGGDDCVIKIWDYQSKSCIATLEGHNRNISSVIFHPHLPIIISCAEDNLVKLWHSKTFELENTLDYEMNRAWTISSHLNSNKISLGFDEGTIILQLGRETPLVSMDQSGNVVWVDNLTVLFTNVRSTNSSTQLQDGEIIPLSINDLGSIEIYPRSIKHSPNYRSLCILGNGEYTIYTARKLLNISFGKANEFVWSHDSKIFATRDNSQYIKIFQDNKEINTFRSSIPVEEIFGGNLLAVRSTEKIELFDWYHSKRMISLDVCPHNIIWSKSGSKVVLACEKSFYLISFNENKGNTDLENVFENMIEIHEKITCGVFEGDYCFIYITSNNNLKYFISNNTNDVEIVTCYHLNSKFYLLGYLPKENRIYLMDKKCQIVSYCLYSAYLAFQIDIINNNVESAKQNLSNIPKNKHNALARFLENRDLTNLALEISQDVEHKFELACSLKKLNLAHQLVKQNPSKKKWKKLGDKALSTFNLKLAEICGYESDDYYLLFLIFITTGDRDGLSTLHKLTNKNKIHNLSFMCLIYLNRVNDAINLLLEIGSISEAALMARTYMPSKIDEITSIWNKSIEKDTKHNLLSLCMSPKNEEHLKCFPNYLKSLKIEEWVNEKVGTENLKNNQYLRSINKRMEQMDIEELMKEDIRKRECENEKVIMEDKEDNKEEKVEVK